MWHVLKILTFWEWTGWQISRFVRFWKEDLIDCTHLEARRQDIDRKLLFHHNDLVFIPLKPQHWILVVDVREASNGFPTCASTSIYWISPSSRMDLIETGTRFHMSTTSHPSLLLRRFYTLQAHSSTIYTRFLPTNKTSSQLCLIGQTIRILHALMTARIAPLLLLPIVPRPPHAGVVPRKQVFLVLRLRNRLSLTPLHLPPTCGSPLTTLPCRSYST